MSLLYIWNVIYCTLWCCGTFNMLSTKLWDSKLVQNVWSVYMFLESTSLPCTIMGLHLFGCMQYIASCEGFMPSGNKPVTKIVLASIREVKLKMNSKDQYYSSVPMPLDTKTRKRKYKWFNITIWHFSQLYKIDTDRIKAKRKKTTNK